MANPQKKTNNFFQKVYEVTYHIPPGRVTSYGAIAKFLGTGKSSRMVGWAMNSSHRIFPPVPAHRVVNRNGLLSGKSHFGDPLLMQQMLEKEGVEVVNDQVVAFENLFWDPATELSAEDIISTK